MPAPPGPPNRGLSRAQRMTRSAHFQEAYDQGRKWVGRYMVLYLRVGEGAALRLGVVASRRVGRAHERNRARRLLREAYRRNRHRFQGQTDVVLIARASVPRAAYSDVEADLLTVATRAGIVKPDGGG